MTRSRWVRQPDLTGRSVVVTHGRIWSELRDGADAGPALERVRGDRLVWVHPGPVWSRRVGITNTSGDGPVLIRRHEVEALEQACRTHGWLFGGPSDPQRIANVLDEVRDRLSDPNAVLGRASFIDAQQAIDELEMLRVEVVDSGQVPTAVTVLFLPTGPIQEAAIDSGWGDRFCELADDVDAACANLAGV